jgi:2-succinyl-5-enolpyruvyl-6-hydroxy-3-cyclohexene-1-carboxylate synthase
VATPHGLDFAHAARLYGLAHEVVRTPESFRAALDAATGATIIEVRTEREANLELHRRVSQAVVQSVRGHA